MAHGAFGRFSSISAFLAHDARERQRLAAAAERGLPFEEQVRQRRQQVASNVVEVAATLKQREATDTSGAEHLQLLITVTKIIQNASSASVAADVKRVLADGESVFLAIRIGDSEGITQPITGLVVGVGLDIKGEWIPKAQAGTEGGEAMSVLHYTHHPIGFICVEQPPACYQ